MLIVDDSNMNRKMLCKVLRAKGHAVEEAEDGLLAIEKIKKIMCNEDLDKNHYDFVLMDFIMPNMDGPSATKVIRELGYVAPIFGLTGNVLDSDIEIFMNNGADTVMAKPFKLEQFKVMTDKYMKKSAVAALSS
jgi:CheY-like chemotaxis protein